MALTLGVACVCERNTGSYETPTWDPITILRDGTLGMEMDEADATHRGSGRFRQSVPTLCNLSYEAELLWDPAHADHAPLWTAFKDRAKLDLQFRSLSSADIWRSFCHVLKFPRSEPLGGAATASIMFRPIDHADQAYPQFTA